MNYQKIGKQFIKFGLVGVLNTGVDYLVYIFLTRLFDFWRENLIIAQAISFLVANINSYLINKYWTFQDYNKQYRQQYFKFLVVSVVGLGINLFIFSLLLKLGVYDLLAKVVPIPVVFLWNFVVNKIWTFTAPQSNAKK